MIQMQPGLKTTILDKMMKPEYIKNKTKQKTHKKLTKTNIRSHIFLSRIWKVMVGIKINVFARKQKAKHQQTRMESTVLDF